jgi:hypothetical protein
MRPEAGVPIPPGRGSAAARSTATLALLAACLCLAPLPIAAQDRVVLHNGVTLDGEIQEARRGEVSFDNEELDVVSIDVSDIAELTSPSFFEVTDLEGEIYRGSLAASDSGTVIIAGPDQSTTLNISDIVRMLSFASGFWGRTNGHLDIGANVAAANSLSSLLVDGLFAYRGPRWGTRSDVNAYWQRQTTTGVLGGDLEETTSRAAVGSSVSRYLGRWSVQGSGDWETNEELDLQSRVQIALSGIFAFVQGQAAELSAGAGIQNNTESYFGENTSTTAEIVSGATLDVFDRGDVDVYLAVRVFTNLNQWGRFRSNIDGRVSWEIIDDFTIGISLVERLDTRPPSGAKRDFQYGLTIGWSWS